uniref:Uncharacterized protein n=1 Tax=Arundo donax TaxID=35708 RepID=A0A0A8Z448_ARUDO
MSALSALHIVSKSLLYKLKGAS